MNTLLLVSCLIASTALLASEEASLLGDLQAAKSFNYCVWAYEDGGDLALLPDVSAYLVQETSSADHRKLPSAIVIDAGIRIAKESPDLRVCENTFSSGRKLVSSARRLGAKQLRRKAKFKKSRNDIVADVQVAITDLWLEDQVARFAYIQTQTKSKSDALHWAHRVATADAVAIDEKSAQYMMGLLAEFDWVDIHRFSRPISQHAWILIQHSDDYVDLQKLALDRMEPYLESGGVLRRNYAYLWDRVAVNSGELQRYGTQPDWQSCNDGMLALMPMEEPASVDERRSTMQLGPVLNDLEQMSRQTCN